MMARLLMPRSGHAETLPMQVTQPSGVPTLQRGGLIAPATHVRAYLARFHIASATVPVVEAGFVYFSSSAVSEIMIRFWLFPFKLGNEPPSMFVVRVLLASSTDHVPILAIIPCTTDLFSSAVPWFTLLAANLGISEREIM